MKLNKLIISLLALCLIFFIACESESDTNTSEDGRLIVRLTDAPFPHHLVSEANVIISKIEIRSKNSGDEEDFESDDMVEDESGSPFLTISEEEIEVNLLDLTNGITKTLVDAEIPAGEYDLIRLHTKGVNVVLEDGKVFDLRVPSGQSSGLKVFIKPHLNVVGGLTSDLLLDFDVSRSFVFRGNIKNGNINGVIFKPVIKAVNLSTSGTLSGLVYTSEDESNFEAIRINSGGPEFMAENGDLFVADEYFDGGSLFETTEAIVSSMDDALYQTERFGDFSYEIPVPGPGLYDIKLHFAEIFYGIGTNTDGAGTRIFNVNLEENQVLSNFDILAETNPATALIKEFKEVEISDGFASIDFVSLEDNAKISAIEVVPVETSNEEGRIGLDGAQVSIFAADTLNTTTFTDESGMYMVMGLLAGSYDVEVELEGYMTKSVNGVPINEANQTTLDFELEPEP